MPAVRKLSEIEVLLSSLLSAASENHAAIVDGLEKFLTDRIDRGEEAEALFAVEITSRLGWLLYKLPSKAQQEVFDAWERLANRIFDNCSDRIAILSSKHFHVCCEAIWRGKARISDLVKWHGTDSLFRRTYFTLFPDDYFASLAFELVNELRFALYPSERPRKFIDWNDALKDVGRTLFSYEPPWIKEPQSDLRLLEAFFHWLKEENVQHEVVMKTLILDSEAQFGLFALFAVSLEYSPSGAVIDSLQTQPFFDSLRHILIARFKPDVAEGLQEAIALCGFTVEQQEFIWRWTQKALNLVHLEPLQVAFLEGENGTSLQVLR